MINRYLNKIPKKSYENLGLSMLFGGYGIIYAKCCNVTNTKFIDYDRVKDNKSKIEAVDGPKVIITMLSLAFFGKSIHHLIKFIKT